MYLKTPHHDSSYVQNVLNKAYSMLEGRGGRREGGRVGGRKGGRKERREGGEQYSRIVYINDRCEGSCNKATAHHRTVALGIKLPSFQKSDTNVNYSLLPLPPLTEHWEQRG